MTHHFLFQVCVDDVTDVDDVMCGDDVTDGDAGEVLTLDFLFSVDLEGLCYRLHIDCVHIDISQ